MSTSSIKKIGKANMKLQWGASLVALIIFSALIATATVIPVIGNLIVIGPLTFGLFFVFYSASKGEKINFWDLFKGFETCFGETFLSQILVSVFTFLWSMLFIVPGIIKTYAYSMTLYLQMREPGLEAQEAIKKSQEYMKGYKMNLFLLDLSFLGWDILEVLTCGILMIYVEPWKMHCKVEFFNQVYDKRNFVESTEETVEVKVESEPLKVDPKFVVKDIQSEKTETIDEKPAEEWTSQR